jgi:RHS repeat-associated protein
MLSFSKIHYLSGGAMLIQNNGVDSLLYAYSDFQGSLIALTDVSGNVVEKYAYDPWGARRNPTDWTQKDLRTKWITNRGYTRHEHLDAFGIINMNGRVYDPLTAMFMSPDPYVQAPGNWLNYNRYGYCMENPFRYTDPSGYNFFGDAWRWLTHAVGDVVSTVGKIAAWGVMILPSSINAISKGDWSRLNPFISGTISNNAFQIGAGLFKGTPGQILSRLTWELPQTLIGFGYSEFLNTFGQVDNVNFYDGATVLKTYGDHLPFTSTGLGVTLGSFIIGSNAIDANPNNKLFQHEYGHYLQSQESGWAYLSTYALPSLMGDNA